MKNIILTVPEDFLNQRLDSFLTDRIPMYSRSFLQKIIQLGHVKANGVVIKKNSYPVCQGTQIEIAIPENERPAPELIAKASKTVSILFEHKDFFIINKPTGLIVHKPHRLSTEVSVVDWLLEYNLIPQSIGMPNRPGIIHRLDRDTSGILLIARTMHGLATLGSLFANRMIQKTYLAVVQGHTPESGVINSFIGRDPVTKVKMKAHHVQFDHTFRTAVTEFKTVKQCNTYSIIHVFPKTGRTHQIRVHCASISHPILADTTYGQKSELINRQALHALAISFIFDGKVIEMTAPVPEDIRLLL